ncbi:MAG TPA: ABC transporter permease, partial [Dehalococcoidales bacterium]|nr:ABC transporter permease [Dehalococcoidales bacterium]
PVTRAAFVGAKMAALSLNLAVSLLISALVCYAYSVWLIGPADLWAFVLQNALLLVFLIFCLSLTLMFSSLYKSGLAAGGLAMAAVIVISILSTFPRIGNYLPGKLPGWGVSIITGTGQNYWWALGITLVLTLVCLYLSQHIVKRKDL